MPASVRPPALTTLQAGRGLAALLVVLFHATGLFASERYWGARILHGFFSFGHAGVEFFFALSGFIMILVHRNDIGTPGRLGNFAIKRATRIYPIYWFITLAVFLLYLYSGNNRLNLYKNSVFLIGPDNEAILAVAWTLFHEVLFYLFFGILIINRKAGVAVLLLWFAVCSIWIAKPSPHYAVASVNLVFGFGMLAALGYTKFRNPILILCAMIIAFIIIGYEEVYVNLIKQETRSLFYGAASAIGIAAAVGAEKQGLISSPRWLSALGDSSYSLYLVHYPVLAIAAQLWLATPLRILPTPLAFCALVAIAIAAGFLTYWLVERRLLAMVGRWRR